MKQVYIAGVLRTSACTMLRVKVVVLTGANRSSQILQERTVSKQREFDTVCQSSTTEIYYCQTNQDSCRLSRVELVECYLNLGLGGAVLC